MDQLSNSVAENAIISGLFQHGRQALYEVEDILGCNDFYQEFPEFLYPHLQDIFEKREEITLEIFKSHLESAGLTNKLHTKVFLDYLEFVTTTKVTLNSLRDLAKKVARLGIARNLLETSDEIKSNLLGITGDETISQILDCAEAPIFDFATSFGRGDNEPTDVRTYVEEYLQKVQENPVERIGVPIGFDLFESALGGVRPGLHVIAARMNVGKSMLADAFAVNCTKEEFPALYMDTEMTLDEHMPRLLGNIGDLDGNLIETGQFTFDPHQETRIRKAAEQLTTMPYYHKDIASMTFDEHLAYMRRWLVKEVGLNLDGTAKDCIIFYDYLKLGNDSVGSSGEISMLLGQKATKLQDFAKKYQVPVIAFAQQNREGILRDDLGTIGNSDEIARYAITVSVLARKSDEEIEHDGVENGKLKLVVKKGRFSGVHDTGEYINLKFVGSKAQIKEVSGRENDEEIRL